MNKTGRFAIVAAAGVVATLAGSPAASAAPPQRHAVIVGINDYADRAIPALKYAESDAMAVYAALADPNVGRFPKPNIALLLGREATAGGIKAALHALRGVGKDDLVVVFYSGHGTKEGDEAFWVTQDARRAALPATALPNADIRRFLANIPSQRLVVLLDCCYAASTVKKSLDDPGKLFGDFAGKGRVTIAGAADTQEALEMPSAKAGLFTHFLVAGLRGKADTNADGAVTFDELWNYLGENVRKASVKQGGLHEPKIITEDGMTPQFLLTYNPSAKAAGDKAVTALRSLFDVGRITGSQYDEGRTALMEPALDAASAARREAYADLAAGKLDPKYLATALKDAGAGVATPPAPAPGDAKPAIAVLPFDVLGRIDVPKAGEMIAERLLPMFGDKYALVDQMQLKRFIDQDDLTVSGLAELAVRPATKALTSKAVKLRAVRYLVLGSISASPDGGLSVTARLTDWQTGRIESGRVGQIAGDNWTDLLRRLPLLAAKLTGTLGDLGPGPEDKLPPLPTGVDALTARILQLEAIESELKKAEETLADKHPRIRFLWKSLGQLAKALVPDLEAKLKELTDTDKKLADLYKETHPRRAEVLKQIEELQKTSVLGLLVIAGMAEDREERESRRESIEAELKKAETVFLTRVFDPTKTLTLDLGGGVKMHLALIPAGKFLMGSPETEKGRGKQEGPQREVTITKPFYMGVYEVTQGEWKTVMGTTPWKEQKDAKEGADSAASYISWNDATAFCTKLSRKTGKAVRLPTEAEWEYACRAGSTTRFCYGDSDDYGKLNDCAWYDKNTRDIGNKYVHPVGRKKANAWGLYDMHGNVWDWCSDWYADSYAKAKTQDPQGPDSGTFRVQRGGSFNYPGGFCRSALRWSGTPDYRSDFGFRVVMAAGVD